MNLRLDRRVTLYTVDSIATVTTECRRWTKGWLARLVAGDRRFVKEADSALSRAGFGLRIFTLPEPGNYEADSVCASLRSHRIRFDVRPGGVIVLRGYGDAHRCGHLRLQEWSCVSDPPMVDPLQVVASMRRGDHSWKAGVLLGGILEDHLRKLCQDRGLETEVGRRARGIESLSSVLKSAGVYSKQQHQVIIDIARLRKEAQHEGKVPTEGEALEALQALAQFISAFPATAELSVPASASATT